MKSPRLWWREAASTMARSVTAANSSSRWLSMMSMVPSIEASSLPLGADQVADQSDLLLTAAVARSASTIPSTPPQGRRSPAGPGTESASVPSRSWRYPPAHDCETGSQGSVAPLPCSRRQERADLTAFLAGKTIIANDNANFQPFPRHKRSINQAAVRPALRIIEADIPAALGDR